MTESPQARERDPDMPCWTCRGRTFAEITHSSHRDGGTLYRCVNCKAIYPEASICSALSARHSLSREEVYQIIAHTKARDDEGEFPDIWEHLDYSGENKSRTIIYAAADAILALGGEGGWRDISSAPKDETVVDLWADGRRWATMNYKDGNWRHSYWSLGNPRDASKVHLRSDVYTDLAPTHWRPLPPPPAAQGNG